jgi:hypothetical protein
MTFGGTLSERRRALQQRPDQTFVERDEYFELLLSTRKLVRSDEPAVGVRGLLDVESGKRYLIKQEQLFAGHG